VKLRRAVTACLAAIRAARSVDGQARASGDPATHQADVAAISPCIQCADRAAKPANSSIPVRPEYRAARGLYWLPRCLGSTEVADHVVSGQTVFGSTHHLNFRKTSPSIFAIAGTALVFAALTIPAHAQSYDWGGMAIISSTMGVTANRLCVGEGTRGDVGCPAWAPTATTVGLEVSGTISATALVINGQSIAAGTSAFASLTDVSYSAAAGNIFGPGSLTGAAGTATTTTAFGINALAAGNLTGAANSAFGSNALRNASTGNYNSAFGAGALNAATSGNNNNAFGVNALKNISGGNYNVGIGNNALVSATVASSNIGIGMQSLYNLTTGVNNAAIGFSAGFYGTSGNYNSLFGSFSGQNITTGGSNLLLGYNAGGSITVGSSNTIIGASASPYSNIGNNQLAIANAIWGDTGNGITLQAKIGINVTSPTASLTVSGTVSATRFVGDGSGLTGIAAASNDNIASGTAYVKALQDTGAKISGSLAVAGPVSATGDVKGNTLQLVNAPADACSPANAGAFKRAGTRFYFCRP